MTSDLAAIVNTTDWSKAYNLAERYKKQEQWQAAAQAYRRAIELRADFFWSYHHLGDALTKLEQWEQAAQAYNDALKLDPSFFWSWHNLGDALTKLKQWEQATQAYDDALKLDPSFFWSWHNLGDALTKLQQWDRAIASYLQAVYLQPENQLVYQKLGVAFKQRGVLAKSIQNYRQLAQSPQQNSVFQLWQIRPERLIDLASTLAEHHQVQGAIIVYYMVLEILPTQSDVMVHLAQLLKQQSQLEQAVSQNQHQLQLETSSLLLTQHQPTAPTKSPLKPKAGKFLIETNASISLSQLNELYLAVGWSRHSLAQIEQALNGSFCYVSATYIARDNKQLVGFARAISDGVFQATLLDIAVHPDFQGRKIGKTVLETLIRQLQQTQIRDITLFASPHLADFYHKQGFLSQPHNLQWMLWCPPADKL